MDPNLQEPKGFSDYLSIDESSIEKKEPRGSSNNGYSTVNFNRGPPSSSNPVIGAQKPTKAGSDRPKPRDDRKPATNAHAQLYGGDAGALRLLQSKFRRMETLIDVESKYYKDEEDEHGNIKPMHAHSSAKHNKKKFMDTFSVDFQLPSLYVLDAKAYPKNPKYCVQLVKYQLPHDQELSVHTHMLDGTTVFEPFAELFKKYDGHVVLRLLCTDERYLHMKEEFVLEGAETALIKFSDDGEYFACMYTQKDEA